MPHFGERPWHRIAIRLHLEGWSTRDIAKELTQQLSEVSRLLCSDYAKQMIADTVAKDSDTVERILNGAGLDSIYTLMELRDLAESESVRFNSARALLEHGHGKPLQRSKVESVRVPDDPKEEADRLKADLKMLAS